MRSMVNPKRALRECNLPRNGPAGISSTPLRRGPDAAACRKVQPHYRETEGKVGRSRARKEIADLRKRISDF
jgi:hypothetical protein